MGRTRDLFKEIRDTKGIFHAKMGTIKDRNGKDLTEQNIKKRWQEYTEELYKKDLHDPDNHPVSKESACNAENPGLILGSGRSCGGRNGNPLQSSCLGDPMDRGAWWATVHGVTTAGHDLATKRRQS